jgi:hypothetical protein
MIIEVSSWAITVVSGIDFSRPRYRYNRSLRQFFISSGTDQLSVNKTTAEATDFDR